MPVPEQAAEWHVELNEPEHTAETRRQFFKWLKKSPQHIEEFLAISQLEQSIRKQSTSRAEILDEAKSAVRQRAVPLFPDDTEGAEITPVPSPRRWRPAALAGAAMLAVLAVFLVMRLPIVDTSVTTHKTELGEQRSIALSDGSIVTLNTLSEVAVRFDENTRQVTLQRGEALFDVVHDPARPFVVNAGLASVDVVGTKFSIYRKGDSTQVAVLQGTVNARSNSESGNRIELRGGEGAVFTRDGAIRRDEGFDVQRAVAWTERRLVFDKAQLADVAREFNRYNRMQLQIEDVGLADREITMVFNAHDVSALVGFLQLQPDVEVDYGTDTIRIRTQSQ